MKHRRMGRRGVAGQDGLDDRPMLGVRARNAAVGAKLRAAERRQPSAQSRGEIGQNIVMRAE